MSTRYAALLRSVNVGGNNMLPMKDLAAMFVSAGCTNVETYIQSGNVVFSASAKVVSGVSRAVEKQIPFQTTVILRSLDEMRSAVAANPYPDVEKTHIVFLASEPTSEQISQLDPMRSPPDQFTVMGKHLYLFMPNGMGRTKLTNAYFDSRLKTVSTARNWRTVNKLLAMMAG